MEKIWRGIFTPFPFHQFVGIGPVGKYNLSDLLALLSRVATANSDTYAALARLGFGLLQVPRYRYAEDVAAGTPMEVLPAHPPSPTPISVLYPRSRQLSPPVRVFIDWPVDIVVPKL